MDAFLWAAILKPLILLALIFFVLAPIHWAVRRYCPQWLQRILLKRLY
jgi:hypothetical protein